MSNRKALSKRFKVLQKNMALGELIKNKFSNVVSYEDVAENLESIHMWLVKVGKTAGSINSVVLICRQNTTGLLVFVKIVRQGAHSKLSLGNVSPDAKVTVMLYREGLISKVLREIGWKGTNKKLYRI